MIHVFAGLTMLQDASRNVMKGALRLKLPAQMTAVFSEETNHSFSVDLSFTVPEF